MAVATPPRIDVRRFLTVDDVIRMSAGGIIGETERVELVEGVLVEMSPESQPHIGLVTANTRLLHTSYGPEYGISVQCTLKLHEHGYRIPDFVVSNAPLSERPPRPEEIALVIEVAVTSLDTDLDEKAHDYAAFGVPHYWALDVSGRRLIAHSEPGGGRYAQIRTLAENDEVTLPRTQITLRVADLLAPIGSAERPPA